MPANAEQFAELMRSAGLRARKPEAQGMSKVSEYRQHAKECRVLAHRSRSSQHRDMLLNMAATWESLADDRIKTAEGREST
jgi:hypothetical protein